MIQKTTLPQRTLEKVRWAEALRRRREVDTPALSNPQTKGRLSSLRGKEPGVSVLMQSLKGTFSRTQPPGKFWQRRSYIRVVEDDEYFWTLTEYIRNNYTKMDLADSFGQPPFVFFNHANILKMS